MSAGLPDVTVGPATETVDVLVLGGGAAGLSLVCHLAAAGWTGRLMVVDDGARPTGRRAWAYWSRGRLLLDDLAGPGVDRLKVRGPSLDRVLTFDDHRYRVMTGATLEKAARSVVGNGLDARFVRGAATSVHPALGGAVVRIDPHDEACPAQVRAAWVFDSVGPGQAGPDASDGPHLDLVGHHVRTVRDVFDPTTPVLMDFLTDQDAGLRFVYVLPTSPREALVESTRFVVPTPGRAVVEPHHAAAVTAYVEDLAGTHQVLAREAGVIPLHTRPPAGPHGRVVPIGTRAGMVKAGTGYGWTHIQRHSAALADSLVRHGHPYCVPPVDRWHRGLDSLLLEVVRDEPAAVVDVFSRLFARSSPDRVVDFLEQESSPARELRLFATLPVGPYRRAAVRRLRARRVARPHRP